MGLQPHYIEKKEMIEINGQTTTKVKYPNIALIRVYVEKCREDAVIPQYARPGDAGVDLVAAEDVFLLPQQTAIVPTGIKVALPEGYELQIRPRSGLSLNTGLRLANSPGTIDSGYRDEIGVIVTNTGEKAYLIQKGDRIAQAVLQKVPKIQWVEVEDVSKIGTNRGGGFGSTGRRVESGL